jgi:hypothetical protein
MAALVATGEKMASLPMLDNASLNHDALIYGTQKGNG